jgi:hypothetical protein
MTKKSPNRYLMKWLEMGRQNPCIREADDPPFTTQSFHECRDENELLDKLGNRWCIGQAFFLGELCFIQQIEGGREWLAVKQDVELDMISFGAMIERHGRVAARTLLEKIRDASVEHSQWLHY